MGTTKGSGAAHHGGSRTRAGAAGALLAACVLGWSATAAQAAGAVYLTETFTGASADPLFTAYGSACLTGAPAGTIGPGEHPLGGCATGNLVSSPPRDAAPLGYLQLTDASTDQSGAVLFNTQIVVTGTTAYYLKYHAYTGGNCV